MNSSQVGKYQPYDLQQTKSWLSWLANGMNNHGQTVFLIEQLQPSWLSSRRSLRAYVVASRLIIGFAIGLILFLATLGFMSSSGESISDIIGSALFLSVPISAYALSGALIMGVIDYKRLEKDSDHLDTAVRPPLIRMAGYLLGSFLSPLVLGFPILFVLCGPFYGIGEDLYGYDAPYFMLVSILWILGLLGILCGLLFGAFFGVKGLRKGPQDDISTVESLRFSKGGVLKGGILGFLLGFLGGAVFHLSILVLDSFLPAELRFTPATESILQATLSEGLAGGTFFGILGGILGGFRDRKIEARSFPNQGISLSVKYSLISGISAGFIVSLWLRTFSEWSWPGSLSGGLAFLILFALWFGGTDVIKHYTLRLILHLKRYTPWNYANFLNYAAQNAMLQRAGGGYVFIHRTLLDHFAKMP